MSTGDLRLAARALSRSRGFAVTAVLSFALAIALNTTIYSLLAALIDPQIDVRKPEQLYSLRFFGDYHHRLPRGALESALTSGVPGLTGISGTRIAGKAATVEHGQQEFDARVLNVRVNLFAVLGTRALEGRLFTEADAAAGAPVAIVSDGLVARLFPDGALPINATIAVDGQPYTVIGVVRRSTVLSELSADAWLLPSGADRTVPVNLIRLADGVDPKSVGSQLEVIAARLAVAAGDKPSEARLRIVGGATRQFRVGKFHWALAAGALAVLLVACSNLANLQLARGLARSSEMALRSALGATRGDLVALVMYEVALLAAGGLVLGLVLAYWGTRLIRATIPSTIAGYLVAPNVHWEMLGVAVAATLVCLVIVGLWPAWRIARADPSAMIQSRAGTGAHRHHRRRYAAMIVVQIALALPLLCGAALVSRSDWRLERSRFLVEQFFGYDPTPIVSGTVTIDADRGAQVPVANVASDLMSRMRAIHGVLDAVVIGSAKPLKWSVTIQDQYGYEREFPAPMWEARLVTPSYLRTLARPLVAGADFNEGAYTVPEVIMDEPTARYLWRGGDAVGRLIKFGDARSDAPWARVVGVFHDQMDTTTLRLRDPAFGRHLGSVYRTFTPSDTGVVGGLGLDMTVLARVHGDPHAVAVQMRHVLWTMPGIRSSYVLPLEDRWGITDQRTAERFVALIFAIFAVLGTVLAALGVYGIVSHSVTERRREFGVRISLGATTRHVLHDVLREGNVVVLLGIAGGLFFTKQPVMWLMPFLNGKDDMYDAPLFAAIAIALMATAWVAALVPALRATRIDPVDALRNE
jgi:putative ABC transport system permease protein